MNEDQENLIAQLKEINITNIIEAPIYKLSMILKDLLSDTAINEDRVNRLSAKFRANQDDIIDDNKIAEMRKLAKLIVEIDKKSSEDGMLDYIYFNINNLSLSNYEIALRFRDELVKQKMDFIIASLISIEINVDIQGTYSDEFLTAFIEQIARLTVETNIQAQKDGFDDFILSNAKEIEISLV